MKKSNVLSKLNSRVHTLHNYYNKLTKKEGKK